jgi:signal transduction histidine kinase/ActR/RegA family two-component response regulator
MTAPSVSLREAYRQAFATYLASNREDALCVDVLEVGRSALAGGCGIVDVLALHQSVCSSLIANLTSNQSASNLIEKANDFLTDIVAPFEMALRGWHDIVARLKNMNESLERQVAERTAALRESERRYQDIAEVSADWMWDTDEDHRFINIVGKGLGTSLPGPESYIGKTHWDGVGVDPETDEAGARHRADLDARRPFRGFRYTVSTRQARPLHIIVSGKPVYDEMGAFRGYRGTATDETAIVETRHRAEEAESLLRDAIDTIAGGFVICDAKDRVLLFNDDFGRVYAACADAPKVGAPFEDFVRMAVAIGNHPEAAGREEEWVAQRMAHHRAASGASELQVRDGRWLLVTERRMRHGGSAGVALDITALKAAQVALIGSEERLDRAQAIAGIGSWEVDLQAGRAVWSKQMYRLCGTEPSAEPSREIVEEKMTQEDRIRIDEWFEQPKRGVIPPAIECRMRGADGEASIVSWEGIPIPDKNGVVIRIAGTLRDVTAQRRVEQQFVQAQKMEAIGNLTGGMAHDFNNLLGVIIGNLDLLTEKMDADAEDAELLKDALDAALRGADLTARLLAFARRQPLHPDRVDANDLIAQIIKLLRRTLGEDVEIVFDPVPHAWPIVVDPAQLQSAIANLATNARDAMPAGGRLLIATRNGQLDEDYAASHIEVRPGDYLIVEMTDNGTGIPPEILNKIFDPFFTTKEPGKGTGLGLSMVFGFLRQSGGHINVYSEIGQGTTFRLYLPRGAAGSIENGECEIEEPHRSTGEAILLVEDDAKLRNVVTKQLAELGYRVFGTESARSALDVLESGEPIQLLLTDIVMPGGMDGLELANHAVTRRRNLRVLLTSGFPDVRRRINPDRPLKWKLLSKPYRKSDLARALREALDE